MDRLMNGKNKHPLLIGGKKSSPLLITLRGPLGGRGNGAGVKGKLDKRRLKSLPKPIPHKKRFRGKGEKYQEKKKLRTRKEWFFSSGGLNYLGKKGVIDPMDEK